MEEERLIITAWRVWEKKRAAERLSGRPRGIA